MRPLVDEARLLVVLIFARPLAQQVIVQRRPADMAAIRRAPLHEAHHHVDRLELLRTDARPHVVMGIVGAAADRLHLRRRRIVAAQRVREELLDQAGARPARRRRLGVRAHLFQREQLLVDDRARDRPLADAVAAADFDIVAHGDDRVAATAAPRIAQMRLPEQQPIPHAGYVGAVAQQLEVPAAVDRIAVEHGAANAVAFKHELLVDAARRDPERRSPRSSRRRGSRRPRTCRCRSP